MAAAAVVPTAEELAQEQEELFDVIKLMLEALELLLTDVQASFGLPPLPYSFRHEPVVALNLEQLISELEELLAICEESTSEDCGLPALSASADPWQAGATLARRGAPVAGGAYPSQHAAYHCRLARPGQVLGQPPPAATPCAGSSCGVSMQPASAAHPLWPSYG
jgi:hypothetical protein